MKKFLHMHCRRTSPIPIRTRVTISRYGLPRASTGVKIVNTETRNIPTKIIRRGPKRSERTPEGICMTVYPQKKAPKIPPWRDLSQVNSPFWNNRKNWKLFTECKIRTIRDTTEEHQFEPVLTMFWDAAGIGHVFAGFRGFPSIIVRLMYLCWYPEVTLSASGTNKELLVKFDWYFVKPGFSSDFTMQTIATLKLTLWA